MVTRKDVAKHAGVSVATVSNVMNNKGIVSDKLRDKVLQTVSELSYVPHYMGKSLSCRNSNHIGVMVYEIANPYHLEILQSMEKYAALHGYIVSIFVCDDKFEEKLHAIVERRLSGLVNFVTNQYPGKYINLLADTDTKLINLDSADSDHFINNYESAMLEYFIKLNSYGHRRIGYISTQDMESFNNDSRGISYKKYMNQFGYENYENSVFYNNSPNLNGMEVGYNGAKELMSRDKNITALFTTNDMAAFGVIKACNEMGLNVPNDISVIGCDNIVFSKYFNPSLSTMEIDKNKIGEDIAKSIINKSTNLKSNVNIYNAETVLRESVTFAKK